MPAERWTARWRVPSLESLFVWALALLGLRLGLRPLGDNSTFQHLRTGVDIVAGLGIPRHDPYSFSAPGTPWVVQSWLVDVLYGLVHRLGGWRAVVVLHGLLYGVLAWLVARLARTGTPWRTAAAGATVVALGVPYWSPRPLAVGLVCLALTVTSVEDGWAPWWLLAVGWVWANAHGSWVLGLGWLALVVVGERLDGHRRPRALGHLGALTAGVALGAVNPLGPRLLAFPLQLLTRRDLFSRVVEWQPPHFDGAVGLVLLACVTVIVLALARGRPSWRDALPVAGLLVLGLTSQRNLAALAVVAAPMLGRAFRSRPCELVTGVGAGAGDGDGDGEPVSTRSAGVRDPVPNLLFAGALAALAVAFVAVAATRPAFDLGGYPVALVHDARAGGRVVAPDVVGGYSILDRGRDAHVFVDDRVDMYPRRVVEDSLSLVDGTPASLAILDRYRADAVIWGRDKPLAAILEASGRWRAVRRSGDWVLFVRA